MLHDFMKLKTFDTSETTLKFFLKHSLHHFKNQVTTFHLQQFNQSVQQLETWLNFHFYFCCHWLARSSSTTQPHPLNNFVNSLANSKFGFKLWTIMVVGVILVHLMEKVGHNRLINLINFVKFYTRGTNARK